MSPERAQIIDRIRKLFAMQESADDIGNEHEAAAFAAKVAKLMNQHNVEKSELTPEEIQNQEVSSTTVSADDIGVKYSRQRCSWMEDLAATLASLHQCRIGIITGCNTVVFYGVDDNREIVVALYTFLVPLLNNMSLKAYDRFYAMCEKSNTAWEARGYRASWLNGAIGGITEKIREQQQFAKTAGGVALIRITNQLVDDFLEKKWGKKKSAAALTERDFNSAGYREGKVEGKALNMQAVIE